MSPAWKDSLHLPEWAMSCLTVERYGVNRSVGASALTERDETMVQRFYWLIDRTLAGCSQPGVRDQGGRHFPRRDGAENGTADLEALDRDLAWLRQQDIGAVLSLTEAPLIEEALTRHRLEVLHLPVPDMTAPLPEQFQRALAFIDWQRALGRAVAVHCLVGQGRTATILAAYLIRGGMSADSAIDRLRTICPGAIGSPEQERALHAFAARRDWIV